MPKNEIPRVFLIEDDPTMVGLLEMLLKLENFTTDKIGEESVDGILKQLAEFKPDIIMLDFYLNRLSGLDLLKEIKEHPDLTKARIIMASGSDVKDICIASGANGFIMKPFMPDELIQLIKSQF